MIVATEPTDATADAPDTRRDRRVRAGRRWSPVNVVVAVLVLAGAGLIAYPSGATWITDLTHASTVSGYAQAVSDSTSSELEKMLDAARDYNEHLPDGPLRDPYTLNAEGGADDVYEGREDYLRQLTFAPGAPMARIRIPEIGVDLPIYHGTDEDTLARGVGHLYGSGLPVGGEGTHSVLTGHSGIPGASLFTRLAELDVGDEFAIDVAGETLVYRVDETTTVLPDDGDLLRQSPGHDYVTLLTCTPTGVNTHRLLVRGERIDDRTGESAQIALPAATDAPDVPWGAIAALIGGLAIAVSIARPRPALP